MQYIDEVFKCFNLVGNPFDVDDKLSELAYEKCRNMGMWKEKWKFFLYDTAVELFIYAVMNTRIDLAFVVNTISQYMSRASPPHWMVIKCTMRYLKGTLDYKFMSRMQEHCLERILWCRLDKKCKYSKIHHEMYIFLAGFKLFHGMQETTNHWIVYYGNGVHNHSLHKGGHLA